MRKFAVLFLLVFTACSNRDLPTKVIVDDNTVPEITSYNLPVTVFMDNVYRFSVKVTAKEKVERVRMTISAENTDIVLGEVYLYDDGEAVHVGDGDLIAHDGNYSQMLTWGYNESLQYDINFKFNLLDADDNSFGEFEKRIFTRNIKPYIFSINVPDTLPSGFQGSSHFYTVVHDTNGVNTIASASFTLSKNGSVFMSHDMIYDTANERFYYTFNRAIAVGLVGEYTLSITAVDEHGAVSDPGIKTVYIKNNAPVLSDITAPEEYIRPVNNEQFLITVKVLDDQTPLDITRVMMSWKKPDGTYSANSPFVLYDNGLPVKPGLEDWGLGYRGDLVASDDIYSITGIFDGTQPLGDYELQFWAEDLAGNESVPLVHYITLK